MARTSASERARRLLVLLGTFQRDTQVSLGELGRMLDVSVAEVTTDLELLSMCGVAPYGPDDLVPIFIDGDAVHVFGALPALDRRVRLSPPEARALAAVLQIAGRPDSDPLVTRLLAATSEADPAEIERVLHAAASGDFATTAVLAAGAANSVCVRITHRSAGRSGETGRVIEPMGLFNEQGTWYVEAFCQLAGALRTFRVDRIRSAEPTGEHFEPRDIALLGTAVPRGALPVARVRFEPGTAAPEREWPGMRVVSEDETGTLVEVPFAGTGWIARQVLSYLGRAVVVGPAEVKHAVAGLAAQELGRLA